MNPKTVTYTQHVEAIARDLGVRDSVAMDILYLRSLEDRVIKAAKLHPQVGDFEVSNEALEAQLESLGV